MLNIGLQVYDRTYSTIFSPITEATDWPLRLTLSLASQLLHSEPTTPNTTAGDEDLNTFLRLSQKFINVNNAMILSRK